MRRASVPAGERMELIRDLVHDFFKTVYNVPELIRLGGLVGLIAIVFAETGLMIGFFLPGDSLLITAGLFAAKGDLEIVSLNVWLILAAIVGDATGYWIGYRTGKALYNRPNSLLFRRDHLIKTHEFYEKHGGKTIVIARFMPIVRTFAPVVAGAAEMTYRNFAIYNVAGAVLWVTSMTLTGYFLGRAVPDIDKHIHIVVAVVIFLSLLPAIIAGIRAKMNPQPPAPATRPTEP
jgi:membrane-associated protein